MIWTLASLSSHTRAPYTLPHAITWQHTVFTKSHARPDRRRRRRCEVHRAPKRPGVLNLPENERWPARGQKHHLVELQHIPRAKGNTKDQTWKHNAPYVADARRQCRYETQNAPTLREETQKACKCSTESLSYTTMQTKHKHAHHTAAHFTLAPYCRTHCALKSAPETHQRARKRAARRVCVRDDVSKRVRRPEPEVVERNVFGRTFYGILGACLSKLSPETQEL